mmetsp:Transcript_30771/g.89882  ORF Transcript_30771/g.89882 Transcript_30771/m.89882 type:complete len:202 (-) Transcript_30771:1037-1642(-)
MMRGGRRITSTPTAVGALRPDVSQPGVDGPDGRPGDVDVARQGLEGLQIVPQGVGVGVGIGSSSSSGHSLRLVLVLVVAPQDVEEGRVRHDAGTVGPEVRVAHRQFGQIRRVVEDGRPPGGLEEVVDPLVGGSGGSSAIVGRGGRRSPRCLLHLLDVRDDELSGTGSDEVRPPRGGEGADDGLHGPGDAAWGDDAVLVAVG